MILAGGSSRRLGRPKQLLDLDGEPLLRRTVRNALAADLSEVILVLGSRSDEVAAAVGEIGQRTVVNPDFAVGQSTSLVAGLAAVSTGADGVLVLLGDQPLVTSASMDRLIETFRTGDHLIVQAAYDGVPGNPVLFDRPLFAELAAMTGDEGARRVVRSHRDEVVSVEVGDVADVIDIDTEEDYDRLRALAARRGVVSRREGDRG